MDENHTFIYTIPPHVYKIQIITMDISINTKNKTIMVTEATIEELLSIPNIKEYKIVSNNKTEWVTVPKTYNPPILKNPLLPPYAITYNEHIR